MKRMKDYIPLLVAGVAGLVALSGYIVNGAASRRMEKVARFAEALDAIERYRQLPFTFRRRHDETVQTRAELAKLLAEVQISLAFHKRLLKLNSEELGAHVSLS